MSSYADARVEGIVRDAVSSRVPEIEIQARLFAGEYGTRWATTRGETVEIIHFGSWNREAGPDFEGVKFRFGEGAEREGDLEVDRDPRDWERHGHATNPAYNEVLLQLFVAAPQAAAFARSSENREVAQAQLLLGDARTPPLRHVPGAVDREAALAMIGEAADFRLRAKHAARVRAIQLHGPETAMFHAIASGLGYKNNAIPFLLSAQRVGLRAAKGPDGEARLFGIAGFLQPRTFDDASGPTRDYLKPLWEKWWALRDSFARLVLPASVWKFSGIRPANHPHRRLGALAAIAAGFPALVSATRASGAKGFAKFFENLSHPYWSHHWNLNAASLDNDIALVGPDRVRDLLVNAYFPSIGPDVASDALRALPGTSPGGRVRRASEWLVGSADRTLMRTAYQQQGLLQLHADFGSLTALEAWARIQSR